MERAIFSPLMSLMRAVTLSPTLNTFFGFSILPQDISEMWSKPSAPPRSMNAPKSVTFLTVPSTLSPTAIFSKRAFCISAFLATISCLRSPMTLLLLGLNSVITNSISLSAYLDKSFSYTSDTRLAGMKILASSTITLKPPSRTWETFAVRTSWFSNASSSLLFPLSAASLL